MENLQQIEINQRAGLTVIIDLLFKNLHGLVSLAQRNKKFCLLAHVKKSLGIDGTGLQSLHLGGGRQGLSMQRQRPGAYRAVGLARFHQLIEVGLGHLHKTDVQLGGGVIFQPG